VVTPAYNPRYRRVTPEEHGPRLAWSKRVRPSLKNNYNSPALLADLLQAVLIKHSFKKIKNQKKFQK
jgi:hypothetical protein